MKKIAGVALLFLCGSFAFAQNHVRNFQSFFGGNNLTFDAATNFTADLNTGATGLYTSAGLGLWFEMLPYRDRGITPQGGNMFSVSLVLANSAFYEWRGYDDITQVSSNAGGDKSSGATMPSNYGGSNKDQATSIWFNTFIAELVYKQYWIRVSGIEPEISLSQASIRSVFDAVIANRADVSKNELPLPLFVGDANHYNGNGGIVGLLSRDIVHLNRREVQIAGNVSVGMKLDELGMKLAVKAGSWKKAEENTLNSWVLGGDMEWKPDLSQTINFSLLTAVNYGAVSFPKFDLNNGSMEDPESSKKALTENPVALGIGYDYKLNLPRDMVLKPYAGMDFIYQTKSNDFNLEFGGGLQLFFHYTGAGGSFKRQGKDIFGWGYTNIGDVAIPAAFVFGMNVDKDGFMNAVISFNEQPQNSPIPNLGGFLQAEFMNITGKEYVVPYKYDNNTYYTRTFDDFMFAGIMQLEYMINPKITPYVFGKFIPADTRGLVKTGAPDYRKNRTSLTSKIGVVFMPFTSFYIDVWYERTDVRVINDWALDNGRISVTFGMKNYGNL